LCEHLDALYSYAMSLTRNPTEAEDLAQETCLRALDAWASLRPESNVKSWLFTILRNIWFNQLRHKRVARIVDLAEDQSIAEIAVETSKDPYAAYLSKMDVERVRNAIQQLPDTFREVILLREFEDLSYDAIAEIIGCPTGTVMSRLARARSRLRVILSNHRKKKTGRRHGVKPPSSTARRALAIVNSVSRSTGIPNSLTNYPFLFRLRRPTCCPLGNSRRWFDGHNASTIITSVTA
jgi:RNA polymerase sigma-70 factor, ECF subfamily